jgi:gliding motility-associated-like protein
MKKIASGILGFILVATSSLWAQPSISCPGVNGGNDTTLACTGCATLTATPVAGFLPTTYTAQQIPYNPWPNNGPNNLSITNDDVYSGLINLPFNFCYYGTTFNQVVLGSNGVLTFDLANANGGCPWAINQAIPNAANAPLNSIFFPWHDIDPSVSQGGQTRSYNYGVYGTAPCRVLVVSLVNIPMFGGSCNQNVSLNATQQVVLYETTNIIETYIASKQTCGSWNSGAAIHGLQNATGTAAVVIPGRNFPTQWNAVNDAWRFVPAGAPNYTVQWFQQGNPTPISTTNTVQVCPSTSTTYIAQATYTNCNGSTVVVNDPVVVNVVGLSINPNANIANVSCPGGNNGSVTLNPTGGVGGFTFNWGTLGTGSSISNLASGTYHVTITDTSACSRVDSFVVTQPAAITGVTSTTPALCNGQPSGSASIVAGGGTPGYTYQWLPQGGSGATANNLPAGNYTVYTIDANQCRDTNTVTILQPTPVATSASMTPTSCNGGANGTVSALANGGVGNFVFNWTPINQTGASITGLTAGTYTVTASDSNGCTATANITVTQPTPVSATLTSVNVSCAGGNNGSATAVGGGGTPGFTYLWSNGSAGPQINNLVAGNYTVTVTDNNGCTATNSIAVLQPSPLGGQTFSTNETCVGFCDGTVSVVASGGTIPYSYTWSLPGNPTSSTVQGVCSGSYTVTVTDANGCQFTTTSTVVPNPSPSANAGLDVSFCEGSGGVQLNGSASGGGGAPYYYTWTCATPPCGLSCTNCANPFANPTDSMYFYLVVTDQNGCTSPPDSVLVSVIPRPRVDAGPDVSICGVPAPCTVLQPTILAGFGPFQYNWIPGRGLNDSTIANPCARPDTTTIYALVVTDLATGCTSEFTTTDTVSTVTVNVSPQPIADAGPNRVICDGDTTLLTGLGTGAGPVYDFEWSPTTGLSNPNIINPHAFPAATTHYTLTVWSNGCASIADTVTVFVTEIPTVDAGADRDLCMGDSTLLDGTAWVSNQVIPDSIASFTWSPIPGLSGTTTEDVMASPAQTGYYTLTVVSLWGCENRDSVLVTVNPSPIVDAGPTLAVCEGTGPWELDGTINWYNNVQPGDLQNIIIEWQPSSYIIGPNNVEDVQFVTDSTMYFYFTVTYNTCSHTDSVLVLVFNEVIATAEADTNTICQGDSVLLTSTGGIGGATFTWTPANGLADPSSAITMAAPDTTTTYTVSVFESGCAGTAEVTVNVIPAPVVAFINSFTEGCVPLDVSFTAVAENSIFLTWEFGDSTTPINGDQVMHQFDAPGTYEVTLTGTTFGGCTSTSLPVSITVHDSIHAEFSSNPAFPVELPLPEGQVSFFDETTNSVGWIWSFGDGAVSNLQNPSHNYGQPGEYYVTMAVVNEFGCWSEVTHGPFIMVSPELFIPNVFSPNGDGVNDEFFVGYTGSQPILLSIYDRWGVQYFQTRNKMDGWDGTSGKGGAAQDGTYYYTLTVGEREFVGNITVVK